MQNRSIRALLLAALVLAPGLVLAQTYESRRARHDSGSDASDENSRGAPPGSVRDLPLTGGLTQRLLYAAPDKPRGSIVMFPGGAGNLGIGGDGSLEHGKNFLVRSRDLWMARGYAVVIPDAIGRKNMRGSRSSADYVEAVQALVRFARAEVSGPVFLMGTSQGAIAAMNGAAHLKKGEISGVVLTESVSRQGGSHETVFDAEPEKVEVPALVVANRDDACEVAPPDDAPRIAAAMTHSPEAKILYVEGGLTRSKDCGSLSPHGYYGIENKVADAIVEWMNNRP